MYNQVNYFFESLLDSVIQKYDEKPITAQYDNYAYAVLLWSYVSREQINDDLKEKLHHFVSNKKSSRQFSTFDWARLPQLLATDFLLNHNPESLDILLRNLSCRQSSDRRHHILSTAWICKFLMFDNATLQKSFFENVSALHGYSKEHLLIILNTVDAQNQLSHWLGKNKTRLQSLDDTVKLLLAGGIVLCDTFNQHFFDVQSFVAERFVSVLKPFVDASDFNEAQSRIQSHPLNRTAFALPVANS
jgi:hypothetical protein